MTLFEDWRAFEQPLGLRGAPDYTATRMARAHGDLALYRARLEAIDPNAWSVEQQVDWHLVRAELNGFDFNCRVLRPWERDPRPVQVLNRGLITFSNGSCVCFHGPFAAVAHTGLVRC